MIKVLLAEDDQEQSFLFQTVFDVSGLKTTTVLSVQSILTVTASELPDIILLDIMLQNENGLDAMELLKKDEKTKNIPIFVFTNSNKEEYRKRADELGAAAFIVKLGTTPQEMVVRIKKYLGKE